MTQLHLVYGSIPPKLAQMPVRSLQTSPLSPGSQPLVALEAETADSLFMLAPPGAQERLHDIALALRALKPGAPFTILAPKDKGGSRLAKELSSFGILAMDTPKSHHRICTGQRPPMLHNVADAIEQGAPRQLSPSGLWSQPGIFSWDRLDQGTAHLIEQLPALAGHGADLGCGNGALSLAVLEQSAVQSLAGLDLDRRAIEMSRRNIVDPRFKAIWCDVTASAPIALGSLDFVVMNPPFHAAGHEDRGLGVAFIARAAELLRAGGRLVMVANRHLPYETALSTKFKSGKLLHEGQGFKVHEAIK